jgi:hypothetical protein
MVSSTSTKMGRLMMRLALMRSFPTDSMQEEVKEYKQILGEAKLVRGQKSIRPERDELQLEHRKLVSERERHGIRMQQLTAQCDVQR